MGAQSQAVRSDNPRRFLPAMLQRMQPQVSQLLSFRVSVDGNHSALVMEFVEHDSYQPSAFSQPSKAHVGAGVSRAQPSEARQLLQSAAIVSTSARSAFSSAPSYTSRNSEIAADTTTRPSSLISTRSGAVSPINSAVMPYFTATCWILPKFSRSHEMTTRLASSPNRTNSGGSPSEVRSTFIPIPLASPDSTSATVIPPSEQSWAESKISIWAISISAFCNPAS